jgi:hypothetical protein
MERGFHFSIRGVLLAMALFAFWFWCLSLTRTIGELGVVAFILWAFLSMYLPALALGIFGARPWMGLTLGYLTATVALLLT